MTISSRLCLNALTHSSTVADGSALFGLRLRRSTRAAVPEREGRVTAASAGPMYVIPNCYLGNVPPRQERLPLGCDINHVQVLGSK